MEPIRTTKIPEGENWAHEIKFDGIRGLLFYENDLFKLYTKRGKQILHQFPEIKGFKSIFKGNKAIIDGELTVWSENKHSFHDVLVKFKSSQQYKIKANINRLPLTYVMFDILQFNGEDLTSKPYIERKKVLKQNTTQNNTFIYSDYFVDGHALYNKVKELGYEGIVSKEKHSTYMVGKKHSDWYKIKVKKKLLAVIGGLHIEANNIKSLLLGFYRNNIFLYIGKASIGLSQKDLSLLKQNLSQLKSDNNPFINLNYSKNIQFTKPLLTCWVEYLEWTNSGSLRHPQIIGFSDLAAINANGVEYTL